MTKSTNTSWFDLYSSDCNQGCLEFPYAKGKQLYIRTSTALSLGLRVTHTAALLSSGLTWCCRVLLQGAHGQKFVRCAVKDGHDGAEGGSGRRGAAWTWHRQSGAFIQRGASVPQLNNLRLGFQWWAPLWNFYKSDLKSFLFLTWQISSGWLILPMWNTNLLL